MNGFGHGLIRGTPVDDPAGETLKDDQQPPFREFRFYDEGFWIFYFSRKIVFRYQSRTLRRIFSFTQSKSRIHS